MVVAGGDAEAEISWLTMRAALLPLMVKTGWERGESVLVLSAKKENGRGTPAFGKRRVQFREGGAEASRDGCWLKMKGVMAGWEEKWGTGCSRE
jgi:hypothetical protein